MEPRRYGLGVGPDRRLGVPDVLRRRADQVNSASFTAWQIFALRSVITVPILMPDAAPARPGESLLPRSPGWVAPAQRALVLMWIAYYAALPLISLSAAAVAFYTAPLFMALLSRP